MKKFKLENFKSDVIFTPKPALYNAPDESKLALPVTLDLRDLVLQTEDQGTTPQCAAYTGTSWLESIEWRRTGKPVNYNPQELYSMAKTLDGYPDVDGTTLPAILQGMIRLGWTNKTDDDIRMFYTIPELKRAVHRYGTVIIACEIHQQWGLQVGSNMTKVIGDAMGGHAITCCGYDKKGVFIQNSWGYLWGNLGYCKIAWDVFEQEFAEGGYYVNALNNLEE